MTVEGGPTVSVGERTPTDTGAEPRSGSNLVGPVRSETVSGFVDVLKIAWNGLASAIGRAICSKVLSCGGTRSRSHLALSYRLTW